MHFIVHSKFSCIDSRSPYPYILEKFNIIVILQKNLLILYNIINEITHFLTKIRCVFNYIKISCNLFYNKSILYYKKTTINLKSYELVKILIQLSS